MHYKDGTEAKVGDLVKGTTYNTPKGSIHVGVLLGITPGSTSCNARMAMVTAHSLGDVRLPVGNSEGTPHIMGVSTHDGPALVHREGSGDASVTKLVGLKIDYTACGDLELVHRPE